VPEASQAARSGVSGEEPTQEAQTSKKSEPAPTVAEPKGKFRHAGGERIVAIGDLHGDFSATQRAFRLAGAVDEAGKWSGGKLIVVQTGDQLDRGDDEEKILRFLGRLKDEADEAGGALYVLNGNHETMNVMGDFRYVTRGALSAFESWAPASPLGGQAPEAFRVRANAFLPGGGAAQKLAEQSLIVMVGDSLFAHGGVLPQHVDFGVDRLNRETSEWMRGEKSRPPQLVVDENGPVWTRRYGAPVLDQGACDILSQTLAKLGAKRLVVGHTVQERGMSGACGGRVFRIDVGLAAHYGDRPIQVLEIKGSEAKILTEKL